MSLKSIAFYFFLYYSTLTTAQSIFSPTIHAGVHFSSLVLSEPYSNESINEQSSFAPGYSLGVVLALRREKPFFFRTGFLYKEQQNKHFIRGLRFASDIQSGTTSSVLNSIQLSSMIMPFELAFHNSKKEGKATYIFGGGIWLDLILKAGSKGVIRYGSLAEEELKVVNNDISRQLLSPIIFGGVELPFGSGLLSIELHTRAVFHQYALYLYETHSKYSIEAGICFRYAP